MNKRILLSEVEIGNDNSYITVNKYSKNDVKGHFIIAVDECIRNNNKT